MRWETDWLGSHARLTPDHIVLIDGENKNKWSFAELNDRASRIASQLQHMNIQKGDRIAFLAPNDIVYFDLLFACAKIGAIFVPLNYRLSHTELSYILGDAAVKLVVYHHSMQSLMESIQVRLHDIMLIDMDDTYQDWLSNSDAWDGEANISLHDPWIIIYTGGTTGLPKGVVLSHKNIIANAINTIISWKLSSNDITYTILPLFHTGGLNALTLPVIYAGGTAVIGKQFDAEHTLKMIAKEKITILLLVPTMHHMVLQHPLFDSIQISHNPIFLSGGAPCPLPIYEGYKRRGFSFKEGYGLTEAGPNNFYLSPVEALQKLGSVGKPMIHNHITLRNDLDQPVLVGDVGEIVIEGDHVFAYYWNNPEATEKTIKNGRLYSGDLGRCDEDGYYYIVGRKKEMIITGGENIYPLEVEKVLQNHVKVSEAVVIGVDDQKWGEKVIAFIVCKDGIKVTKEELITYCHQHLARYKTPKDFIFVEELPKTPVGKIDKTTLRQTYNQS